MRISDCSSDVGSSDLQYHRYAFCAVVFVVCMLIMRVVTESPFGYTLRMIRDNATRAAFLGVNVFRVKLICFIASGSIAGVGGIILALFTSGAYPEWAFWAQSETGRAWCRERGG